MVEGGSTVIGSFLKSNLLDDMFVYVAPMIIGGTNTPSLVKNINENINLRLVKTKKIISEEQNKNFKSILLEYSQGKNLGLPQYMVRKEEGPDHDKLFTVEVLLNNEVLGRGKGNSKKKAEQISARNALKKVTKFVQTHNFGPSEGTHPERILAASMMFCATSAILRLVSIASLRIA